MIFVDGADVSDISEFIRSRFPDAVRQARSIAVNDTARNALKFLSAKMTEEVKFPAGYLDEPDRLSIVQYASPEVPQATVRARTRPTLLFRFALGNPTPASTRGVGGIGPGVSVEVKPGHIVSFKSAFVIQLKGSGAFAVAVKNKNGVPQGIRKKTTWNPAQLTKAFYILYGPSVDQVFRTTAVRYQQNVMDMLTEEFNRQLLVQIAKGT